MFNPYYARPIGTQKFENHLLTLMIEGIESEKTMHEAIPQYPVFPKAALNPSRQMTDPTDLGWQDLYFAVLSLALIDYLNAYSKKLFFADKMHPSEWVWFSKCVELENEYFREDEDRGAILDNVLKVINSEQYIQGKQEAIRKMIKRISYLSGWSGPKPKHRNRKRSIEQ